MKRSILGDNTRKCYQAGLSPFKTVAASAMNALCPWVRTPCLGIFSCKGNSTDDLVRRTLTGGVPKHVEAILEDVAKGPTRFHLNWVASDRSSINNAYSMWEGAPWVRVDIVDSQEFFRTDGTGTTRVNSMEACVRVSVGRMCFIRRGTRSSNRLATLWRSAPGYPRYDRLRAARQRGIRNLKAPTSSSSKTSAGFHNTERLHKIYSACRSVEKRSGIRFF